MKIISIIFIVFLFGFIFVNTTYAASLGEGIFNIIAKLISALLEGIAYIFLQISKLSVVIFNAIIQGTGSFVSGTAIDTVWTFIRDLVNMTFIVAMLITAVYKMIGTEKKLAHGSFEKQIIYILIGAFVINFSKVLFGAIVDLTNLVSMIFVNSYKDSINNVFENYFKFSLSTGGVRSLLESILLVLFGLALFAYSVTILFYAIIRMAILSIATALSPLFVFSFFFPKKIKFIEDLKIKEQFFSFAFGGITITFFLWVSLMILSAGGKGSLDNTIFGTEESMTTQAVVFDSPEGTAGTSDFWSDILLKVVAVAILLLGQKTAMKMAQEAGFGMNNAIKKVATGINTFGMTPFNFTKGLAGAGAKFGAEKVWNKAAGDRTLFGMGGQTINQRLSDFSKGSKQVAKMGWGGVFSERFKGNFSTSEIDRGMKETNTRIRELDNIKRNNGGVLSEDQKKEMEVLNMQRTALQLQRKGKRFGEDKLSADNITQLPKDTLLAMAPTLDEAHFKSAWAKINEKNPVLAEEFNRAHQNRASAIGSRISDIDEESKSFTSEITRISGILNNAEKSEQYREFFKNNGLSEFFDVKDGGTVLDRRTNKLINSEDILKNPGTLAGIFQSAKLSSDIPGIVGFNSDRGVYIDKETNAEISQSDAASYIVTKLGGQKRAVKKEDITGKDKITPQNLAKLPINTIIEFVKNNPKMLRDKEKIKELFSELDKSGRHKDIEELDRYINGGSGYEKTGYIPSMITRLSNEDRIANITQAAKDESFGFVMDADGKTIRDAKNRTITYDLSKQSDLEAAGKIFEKGISGNIRDARRVSNIASGSFSDIVSSNVSGLLSSDKKVSGGAAKEVAELFADLDEKQISSLDPAKIFASNGNLSQENRFVVMKKLVESLSRSGKLTSGNIENFAKYINDSNVEENNVSLANGILKTLFSSKEINKIDEQALGTILSNPVSQKVMALNIRDEKYRPEYSGILEKLKDPDAIKSYVSSSANLGTLLSNYQEIKSSVNNPELVKQMEASIREKYNSLASTKDGARYSQQFNDIFGNTNNTSSSNTGGDISSIATEIINEAIKESQKAGGDAGKNPNMEALTKAMIRAERLKSMLSRENDEIERGKMIGALFGSISKTGAGDVGDIIKALQKERDNITGTSAGDTAQKDYVSSLIRATELYEQAQRSPTSKPFDTITDTTKKLGSELDEVAKDSKLNLSDSDRSSIARGFENINSNIIALDRNLASSNDPQKVVSAVSSVESAIKTLESSVKGVDFESLETLKFLKAQLSDIVFAIGLMGGKKEGEASENNLKKEVDLSRRTIDQMRRSLENIMGTHEVASSIEKTLNVFADGIKNNNTYFISEIGKIISNIGRSGITKEENDLSRAISTNIIRRIESLELLEQLLKKVDKNQTDIINTIKERISDLGNFNHYF